MEVATAATVRRGQAKYARAQGKKYDIIVYPLLRPRPDTELLLRALWALVHKTAEQRAATDQS